MSMVCICGCINTEAQYGALRCISKCEAHKQDIAASTHGESYYRSLGIFDETGGINTDRYQLELEDALGTIPLATTATHALEIGCGVSPYVPAISAAGYDYVGIDIDEWTSVKMQQLYDVPVMSMPFETGILPHNTYGLIIAVHVLEHLPDAPGALTEIHNLLSPGGKLILVIPDDTDLTNPDHLWFFNEKSLRAALVASNFEIERFATRKYIERENFLYCLASKPKA